MLNITLLDGKKLKFPGKVNGHDIAKTISPSLAKKASCDTSILNENLNSNFLDVDSEDNRPASQSKSAVNKDKNSSQLIQEVVLNDGKQK